MSPEVATARCACGSVEIEAIGAPITCATCHCADCREGSRRIEGLPNARPVLDPEGGTAYVLYRRDRVRCAKGAGLLRSYKLDEKSATNRVVASCCNSGLLLRFDDSKHWVSVFRAGFEGDPPPVQMRVCRTPAAENGEAPGDVPSYSSFPPRFIGRLIAARIAMLFSR